MRRSSNRSNDQRERVIFRPSRFANVTGSFGGIPNIQTTWLVGIKNATFGLLAASNGPLSRGRLRSLFRRSADSFKLRRCPMVLSADWRQSRAQAVAMTGQPNLPIKPHVIHLPALPPLSWFKRRETGALLRRRCGLSTAFSWCIIALAFSHGYVGLFELLFLMLWTAPPLASRYATML